MNTPPPFGDPTHIRRENAAAVGKGVVFGCGGCLGLVALAFVVMLGIAFIVLTFMRSSAPCDLAFQAAQASEVLTREIGEPMKKGYFITGSINVSNGSGNASLVVPIIGPRGEAGVRVNARSEHGRWIFTTMTAEIQGTSQQVDLLPLLPAENRDGG